MARYCHLLLCFFVLTLSSISAWKYGDDVSEVDYCLPDQVHISLGDAYYNSLNNFTQVSADGSGNNSVYIVWQTQTLCDIFYLMIESANKDFSQNITADQIWNELLDEDVELKQNMINVSGHYTSYSHTVMVSGLIPGVSYTYKIYQVNGTNSAGPFTFNLPEIAPIDSEKPIKFALFADVDTIQTNLTMERLKTLQSQDSTGISFNLFLGDLGYDVFSESGLRGEYYFNSWQSILSSWPFMMTPGNHEIYKNYTFLNFRNRMPLYNKTKNHYYSFNVGKMHILAVNYYFYNLEPELREQMFKWMEDDLIAANASRKERPWVVIATHQPIYCSLNDITDEPVKRCYNWFTTYKKFEDLYFKYKVDMVLQGHVHNWERTGPTYDNKSQSYQSYSEGQRKNYIINPTAPIYTIEGAAGNWYFMAGNTTKANYSINVDNHLSFSTLTLVNGSALKYEHIDSKDGNLIDYFYLLKGDDYIPYVAKPEPKPTKPPTGINPLIWVLIGSFCAIILLACVFRKTIKKRLFSRRTRVDLKIGMLGKKETEILEF